MTGTTGKRERAWMLIFAALLIAWATAGYIQGLDSGFSGGLYDPEYRVPGVMPGGLADKSGFKAGDRVISVEGIPVEELGMESRWPRALVPKVGQTHRFVVERNGERIALDVVYPPPFASAVNNRIGAKLMGLAFLGFGLWAFWTAGTAAARTLAQVGLASGTVMAMGSGVNLGWWNGVKGHVATAASVLMLILLLQFFLTYPKAKKVSRSRVGAWLIWGAWGCVVAFLAVEVIVHPVLYYTTGSVVGPLMMVYIALMAAAITHTLVKYGRAELQESGMYVILGGILVATVCIVTVTFSGLNLPSWLNGLAIAAIPLTMALAVRRQARQNTRAAEPRG